MFLLFEWLGYQVKITQQTGDQGADLILSLAGLRVAVQVKFWSDPVGNHAVQEVVAAKPVYHADAAWVVTNSTFTRQAVELAQANSVKLIEGTELKRWAPN